MKTENELKQILNDFQWHKSGNIVEVLTGLADAELIKLIKLHNETEASGRVANSLRVKMYNELFLRNSIGKASGNYLNFKQRAFLKAAGLLPEKKVLPLSDLERVDRLILQYMKEGYTQAEISDLLKAIDVKPNSLRTVEGRLHDLRTKYKAKTNFHLAVILYGK